MLVANRGSTTKRENGFASDITAETNGGINKNNFDLTNKFSSSQSKLNSETKGSTVLQQNRTDTTNSVPQNSKVSEQFSSFSSSTLNRNGVGEELNSLKKNKPSGVSF